MTSGNRCGCRALAELDDERTRHQATREENHRYSRKIKDLQDELGSLHSTISELERRYSELSIRYRKSLGTLDEINDTKDRLKDHSTEVSETNRRLRLNSDRLELQLKTLKDECEDLKEELADERRKRSSTELTLTRDLEEVDRSCQDKLRRATSIHDIDSLHLKENIKSLQLALDKEKFHHNLTKRSLHHANLHISRFGRICYHHCTDSCSCCLHIP